MGKLAIKGHKTRGNEIIKILEVLGGSNGFEHTGKESNAIYYIDEINHCFIAWTLGTISCNYKIFTLEEFLEKFPYKVGDRVCFSDDSNHYLTIKRMWWTESSNDVECTFLEDAIDVSMKDLQPYKEEIMEEKADTSAAPILKSEDYSDRRFGYKIPKGYEFECVKGNEIIIKPFQYPKTYKECCNILRCNDSIKVQLYCVEHGEGVLYHNFIKLIRCRNAYWKIAGEKMGLGEPWKPDWCNNQFKYNIVSAGGNMFNDTYTTKNCILAFPASEMRDAFKENFKDLIEQCKELL